MAGIEPALDLKFGSAGLALMPEVQSITDITVLRAIRDQIKGADTPEALRRIYQERPEE